VRPNAEVHRPSVAVRCVYELFDACKIPIIGCGGVSSARDVLEMMMAGATAVEIGTAVYRDPAIFSFIAGELYDRDGENAEEIVGCAHA
jgi:dihydroorotate dehydrogenase (NAD+) catalytic subunit